MRAKVVWEVWGASASRNNFGVSHGPLPAPGVLRIDPSWWLELSSEPPGFASLQVGVV